MEVGVQTRLIHVEDSCCRQISFQHVRSLIGQFRPEGLIRSKFGLVEPPFQFAH